MKKLLNKDIIEKTFSLLAQRIEHNSSEAIHLVVCGGSALIATDMISRATKDVDIVALLDEQQKVLCPQPLPESLLKAAHETALTLDLDDNWLNNGPSQNSGGIFQQGLPEGFESRLIPRSYGSLLKVSYIGRLDQICFKFYASVDQDASSYHFSDLQKLEPNEDEILMAYQWSATHDPSDGFKESAKGCIKYLGFENVISKI